MLEHAVLVDAAFVGERVAADDGLVVLNREVRHGRDQFRCLKQHRRFDAGMERHDVGAGADRHHDFFERGIAGAFTQAIDGAFDLAGTGANASERVGDRETQVVVAVGGDDDLVHAGDAGQQHGDEGVVFLGRRIADGIGNVDRGGTGLDRGFAHPAQVIVLGAGGVHGRPFDVIGGVAGPRDGGDDTFEHLLLREVELVLAMQRRGADEGVDAAAPGVADRIGGAVDVAEVGTRQATHDGGLAELGDLADGFEVAIGRDGKAGFDDIDAHLVEDFGNLDFFLKGHGRAGALFAVAQGGVENDDTVFGVLGRNGGGDSFSHDRGPWRGARRARGQRLRAGL